MASIQAFRQPPGWELSFELDARHIWDGLFMYWTLEDCHDRRIPLHLPHEAVSQKERLRPALECRNKAMAGPGQEHWNHACNLCTWVFEDPDDGLKSTG
jgi:hypothetical protein